MGIGTVSATVSGDNQFTDAMATQKTALVSISISGTFSATITLQHKIDGSNWRDVETWTAAAEQLYEAPEDGEIRIGCKTGEYTSGSPVLRLGR